MTLMQTIDALLEEGYQLKKQEGTTEIVFPLETKRLNVSIAELNIKNKALRLLILCKCVSVNDVVDMIKIGFPKVTGVGTTTIKEIKNAVLDWYYSTLSPIEQAAFIKEIFV